MSPPALPASGFQHALRRFEQRLQKQWEQREGAAPAGLRLYRAAWLRQFEAPSVSIQEAAFWSRCAQATPLLVSDFHPLPRSGRQLAQLLQTIDWPRPPRLVLELLPACAPIDAASLTEGSGPRLVDGRTLQEAFPDVLTELARLGGQIAGAWVPGSPAVRDRAAAEAWAARHATQPDQPEILFFGDWHLAAPHLPAALQAHGAHPVCVHQSPAPLWHRTPLAGGNAQFLELDAQHLAWMHTPPHAFWTSARQAQDHGRGESAHESSAELVLEFAQVLAELLSAELEADTLECFGADEWLAFWRTLPAPWRDALAPTHPPRASLLHPQQPLLWQPRAASWNELVEAAAGLLTQQGALRERPQLDAACAFRRLWSRAWNPFLPARDEQELAHELGLALDPGRVGTREASQQFLRDSRRGEAVAAALHLHPLLDLASMRSLLQDGRDAFIWHLGVSTIQASSLRA